MATERDRFSRVGKPLPPSEFGGRSGIAQREEDGHSLDPSEAHSLAMRHPVDTAKTREGGVDSRHREGLAPPADLDSLP